MPRIENTLFCDGCGVEVIWAPVVSGNRYYCCQDCRDGLECSCGERMEFEDERSGELSEQFTAINMYY